MRSYSNKSLEIIRAIDIFVNKDTAEIKAKYLIKEKGKPTKDVEDKIKIPLFTKETLVKIIKNAGFDVNIFLYKKAGTTVFVCIKR